MNENEKYELIENYIFLKKKYKQIYEITKSNRIPVKDKAVIILLLNNILATTAVYPCIDHSDKIIEKYSDKLNDVFKVIKKCEEGYDINKYLKSKESIKGFKRLN